MVTQNLRERHELHYLGQNRTEVEGQMVARIIKRGKNIWHVLTIHRHDWHSTGSEERAERLVRTEALSADVSKGMETFNRCAWTSKWATEIQWRLISKKIILAGDIIYREICFSNTVWCKLVRRLLNCVTFHSVCLMGTFCC